MKTRVKEFRLQKGMTQQQLAKMVHVSNRTIISIEQKDNITHHLCWHIVFLKSFMFPLKNYVV